MAKKVLSFFDGSDSGHGNTKYPWDRWTDGLIWEVTKGLDFDCKIESFRGVLYSYAKRNGMKLQVQSLVRMGKMRFRFYNPAVEVLTTPPVVRTPAVELRECGPDAEIVSVSITDVNNTSTGPQGFGDGL